jgi:hypothetical protein
VVQRSGHLVDRDQRKSPPKTGKNKRKNKFPIDDLLEQHTSKKARILDDGDVIYVRQSTNCVPNTPDSTATTDSSREPSTETSPGDAALPSSRRALRERKSVPLYDVDFHPMDTVLRPTARTTMKHINAISQARLRELHTDRKTPGVLKEPIPQDWRCIGLFDLRLHGLQQGVAVRVNGLPYPWNEVADTLVEQGFITEKELKACGGLKGLEARYNALQTMWNDKISSTGPENNSVWEGRVGRLLKGQGTLEYTSEDEMDELIQTQSLIDATTLGLSINRSAVGASWVESGANV